MAEARNAPTMIEEIFPATSMPDSDWWSFLWPDPERVLAELGVESGLDVVDLCCGDGHFTAPIGRMATRLAAIDLDPRVLELAKAKIDAARAAHCTFIQGNAYDVTRLVPWAADLVFMANTFHGVPDKQRLARAVAVALKPKGRFLVVNWHRLPREETRVFGKPRGPKTEMRMEPAEVAQAIESSALALVQVVELPPFHYGAVFTKGA